MKIKEIGTISNYYGGLSVAKDASGKCFWGIENWGGNIGWEEIPKPLYKELKKFEKTRTKG